MREGNSAVELSKDDELVGKRIGKVTVKVEKRLDFGGAKVALGQETLIERDLGKEARVDDGDLLGYHVHIPEEQCYVCHGLDLRVNAVKL